jgi:hypothetical protein
MMKAHGTLAAQRLNVASFDVRECCVNPAVFDVWTYFDQLVVTVDISDDHCVLQMLRVDFCEFGLMAGNDPTFQVTDRTLDPEDPDLVRFGPADSEELAHKAYAWFRQEACRPIDRHEWDGPDHTWRKWTLADVDRPIVFQYSGRPDRPPDRVIRVDPPLV